MPWISGSQRTRGRKRLFGILERSLELGVTFVMLYYIFSPMIHPWLDVGLSLQYPQVCGAILPIPTQNSSNRHLPLSKNLHIEEYKILHQVI